MDITELKKKLNDPDRIIGNTTFNLEVALLDSDSLTAFTGNIFKDNTIVLENFMLDNELDKVIIRGSCPQIAFLHLDIVATFSIINAEPALAWVAEAKAPTFLPVNFAELADSFYTDVQFKSLQISFSSHHDIGNVPVAVSVNGQINISRLNGLAAFLHISEIPVKDGTLTLHDQGKLSSIQLNFPRSGTIDLGIAKPEDCEIEFSSEYVKDPFDGQFFVRPYIKMASAIKFETKEGIREIPVSAHIFYLDRPIRFSADLEKVITVGPDDLGVLLNDSSKDDFFRKLPGGEPSNTFKLEHVYIDLDTTTFEITAAGVDIVRNWPWKLFHLSKSNTDIVLDKVFFNFQINDPLKTTRSFLIYAGGDIAIGKAGSLSLMASYPEWNFQLALKEGGLLYFNEILQAFIADKSNIPVIAVDMLEIDYRRTAGDNNIDGDYNIIAEIDGDWAFEDWFAIEGAYLSISKEQQAYEATIKGEIKIFNTDLELTAVHVSSEAGWIFTGRTINSKIPIGELIEELAMRFHAENEDGTDVTIPAALQSLTIRAVETSFTTGNKNFTFMATTDVVINHTMVEVVAAINLTQNQNEAFTKKIAGHVELKTKSALLSFDLIFDKDPSNTLMLAAYADAKGQKEIDLQALINYILPDAALPSQLSVTLNEAILAYESAVVQAQSKTLFIAHIGSGINLSGLPLVGKLFTPDKTLKLSFQIQYASVEFESTDINAINTLRPQTISFDPQQQPSTAPSIPLGLGLAVNLQIGQTLIPIRSNLAVNTADPNNTGPLKPSSGADSSTQWVTIQQSLGPVHFNRIGIGFKGGKLRFALDASLQMSGLTIALNGLSVLSSIDTFKPAFDLDGLGIDFKSDAVEIGGSLLHDAVTHEYSGYAVLKFEGISISAFGAFSYLNNAPSLFIYASMHEPLGGAAFFFVTGISAGFGYNRALHMPALNQIMNFPLVTDSINANAVPVDGNTEALTRKLQSLRQFIVPAAGQMFFAAGISFNSFKLVDSSLLVAASFGNRFELNLAGLSLLAVPAVLSESDSPGEEIPTRLAEVQLLLKGAIIPSEGFAGLQGVLSDNSYILSRNCRLSGGFAFFTWFNGVNKGDFVVTIGGYHPHFSVPAFYPRVPRVSFYWNVDETGTMLIKGGMYFALCAHALMAGGLLEATYQSGGLSAWFKMGADFLVAWQPYHYEAAMYLDIGCSYTFQCFGTQHITIDVGADVNLRGPEFGGHAVIHLWIFSINVDFGNQGSAKPTAIDWAHFVKSFLPSAGLCTIAVVKGLVSKGVSADHLGIVNPKELCIITDTFIPSKEVICGSNIEGPEWDKHFGIGPMNISGEQLHSSQTIEITRKDDPAFKPKEHFKFTSITKKAPSGLWGTVLVPAVNDPRFIEDAFSGLRIEPFHVPGSGSSITVDRDYIQFEIDLIFGAITWEADAVVEETSREAIFNDLVTKSDERAALLKSLGLNYVVDLPYKMNDDLI